MAEARETAPVRCLKKSASFPMLSDPALHIELLPLQGITRPRASAQLNSFAVLGTLIDEICILPRDSAWDASLNCLCPSPSLLVGLTPAISCTTLCEGAPLFFKYYFFPAVFPPQNLFPLMMTQPLTESQNSAQNSCDSSPSLVEKSSTMLDRRYSRP